MTFPIHVFLFGKHGICSCPSVPPPGRLSPMSGSLPSFLKLSYHMYSIIPELLVLQVKDLILLFYMKKYNFTISFGGINIYINLFYIKILK